MASIKDLNRLCRSQEECNNCPLFIDEVAYCTPPFDSPDKAEEVVDKWVAEHPKTYAMDFFEKFPNAPRGSDGAPKTCWKHVYGDGKYCSSDACTECWNREMKEDG